MGKRRVTLCILVTQELPEANTKDGKYPNPDTCSDDF